jgi:hypothetical protein
VAAEIADLDNYQVDYRRKEMTPIEALLTGLNSNVAASLQGLGLASVSNYSTPDSSLLRYAKKVLEPLTFINALNDPKDIYLYCEKCPL